MKIAASSVMLAVSLTATTGLSLAAEQNIQTGKPVNVIEGTEAASENKVHGQDLSDKDMKASKRGEDTKVIRMGFKRLDANDDGSITSDEASLQPPLNTQFKTADKNGDNKIDMGEFAQFSALSGGGLQTEQNEMSPKNNPSGAADTQ